jgi:hypothetical protein
MCSELMFALRYSLMEGSGIVLPSGVSRDSASRVKS